MKPSHIRTPRTLAETTFITDYPVYKAADHLPDKVIAIIFVFVIIGLVIGVL